MRIGKLDGSQMICRAVLGEEVRAGNGDFQISNFRLKVEQMADGRDIYGHGQSEPVIM